jgi:hypothetical protein
MCNPRPGSVWQIGQDRDTSHASTRSCPQMTLMDVNGYDKFPTSNSDHLDVVTQVLHHSDSKLGTQSAVRP